MLNWIMTSTERAENTRFEKFSIAVPNTMRNRTTHLKPDPCLAIDMPFHPKWRPAKARRHCFILYCENAEQSSGNLISIVKRLPCKYAFSAPNLYYASSATLLM